ncbi:MAG: hypothetical protein ACE5G1_17585 [bacterium]
MPGRINRVLFRPLAVLLSLFVLAEVNYPVLTPQSQLAIFALLGLLLVFLHYPLRTKFQNGFFARGLDGLLVLAAVFCFGYVLVQSEPLFKSFWLGGQSFGNRAGLEQSIDYIVGYVGIALVLEATRRAIGV